MAGYVQASIICPWARDYVVVSACVRVFASIHVLDVRPAKPDFAQTGISEADGLVSAGEA